MIGVFCSCTRRLLFLAGAFGVIFLITIGSASGLQPFLYAHVPYFRMFRNLHFLLWLAFPLAVLASGEVFRLGLDWMKKDGGKWLKAFVIAAVHAGFLVFLRTTQVHVVWSVYAGVILSAAAFFVFLFFTSKRSMAVLLFFCAIVVQSSSVFTYYARNEKDTLQQYHQSWVKEYRPVFAYQRPVRGAPWDMRDVEGYGAMQDTSGFDYPRFTGSRWAAELLTQYSADKTEKYVVNKFIVYERGFRVNTPQERSNALEQIFAGQCGGAFIEEGSSGIVQGTQSGCAGRSVVLNKGANGFKVLSFGLDHIRFETNWPEEKYLVYNDTFSISWQARLNGRPLKIDRANVAFKGMHLPGGRNIVEMQYDPSWKNLLRVALTWGHVLFAVIVGVMCFGFAGPVRKFFQGRC